MKTADGLDDAAKLNLARRVERICALIPQTLEESLRGDSLTAWTEAQDVADRRNAILHNPVVYWWTGTPNGAPDHVGITDVRRAGSLIQLRDVNDIVDRSARVGIRLFELCNEIGAWYDRLGLMPPPISPAPPPQQND